MKSEVKQTQIKKSQTRASPYTKLRSRQTMRSLNYGNNTAFPNGHGLLIIESQVIESAEKCPKYA
jgi:hypothetical protein